MTADRTPTLTGGFDLALALCNVCRRERAILVWEPQERWAEPLCAGCADDRVELEQAAAISPEARAAIGRARSEPVRLLRPVTGVPWTPDLEREWKALRRRWRDESERVRDDDRCVAIVATGRCVRRAAGAGEGFERVLCETHGERGCRLPGLGWKDGSPVGRIIQRPGRKVA